ncbi:hypothetical protein EST92_11555 [Streptomyces sp. TM32]|uniref:hypothetical protein n=1 Tax=Streptomyces sp. TM32 TaxID=1652669 RepID=UPI0010110FF8|nr:hypothetical protein [Streptomyces sp. TM32]RXS84187.1 hypothetical protein EST92_11555 [Streptomyces sp. TM32]
MDLLNVPTDATTLVCTSTVRSAGKNLAVTTTRRGRCYETVILDCHADRRHHARGVGEWLINVMHRTAYTRVEAMETHQDALHAACFEAIR